MDVNFISEEDLTRTALYSDEFHNCFAYPGWKKWEGREIEGLFGVPDVVFAFGKTTIDGKKIFRGVAFEMKLKNWKRALIQAYRYASFAHYSFVVMDDAFSAPAIKNLDMFQKANIGLMTVSRDSSVKCHYRPQYRSPYSYYTYKNLRGILDRELF